MSPIRTGKDFLGADAWLCSSCGLRWYDSPKCRYKHRDCTTIKLYVSSNRDGILCAPQQVHQYSVRRAVRSPDSSRRVFVGGSPDLCTLTEVQIRALIDLAYRKPGVHKNATEAIFYDSNVWGASDAYRHKVVLRVPLP